MVEKCNPVLSGYWALFLSEGEENQVKEEGGRRRWRRRMMTTGLRSLSKNSREEYFLKSIVRAPLDLGSFYGKNKVYSQAKR